MECEGAFESRYGRKGAHKQDFQGQDVRQEGRYGKRVSKEKTTGQNSQVFMNKDLVFA